ncbi:DUF2934 domain-containing protein [Rhodoligotrophos defluvii]|uniref:DUF2934 domain-containing protein n=1 Tax=Rhodoligotrophos defluvii TaxID=2561934 RepID=UPI0010CA1851|nr:DUF2934 domain-containing protein [Rhodoligotrophos defluvii]
MTRDRDRQEKIRQRAYAIWEAEGRPHNRDREHWLQAENEVMGHAGARSATRRPSKSPGEEASAATGRSGAARPATKRPDVSAKAKATPATTKRKASPAEASPANTAPSAAKGSSSRGKAKPAAAGAAPEKPSGRNSRRSTQPPSGG